MDIGSISAAISGLKATGEAINSLLKLKMDSAVNAAIRELSINFSRVQSELLSAQSEQLSMIEEIRNLKEKLMQMENWDSEKKRYGLKKIGDYGAVAYALKEDMAKGEPPHYICANCYNNGTKGYLTPQKDTSKKISLICTNPKCKSVFNTFLHSYVSPEYLK